MLLTHTAGFAYPFSDGRVKSFGIKDQHVIFEPGTGWVYSVIVLFFPSVPLGWLTKDLWTARIGLCRGVD